MTPRNSKCAGYSLFEVLLAFAIMSLVLAVLIPGQAALFRRAGDGEAKLLAMDYALSQIEKLGISEPLYTAAKTHTYRDWQVEIAVAPVPDGGAFVTVVVTDAGTGKALARVETTKPAR